MVVMHCVSGRAVANFQIWSGSAVGD
jgi:hypothetical protein